ncbi:hypothetical protein [Bradyrhizobium canariense]|uniref:Uncharacterized protein n=1 Tax=Bradyrhizobium canariense TaxID=255045 RepID=A0A1H2ALY9_9BRAD|nr:hypothetical protein [Bradyrhizobium canariense]SDT46953.1 hypothetical protein SAMN05444158_6277 [Bradyrhizobium canariense]
MPRSFPVTLNGKTLHVIMRFSLRMLVLCLFSAFGKLGFARSLAALLLLSVVVCIVTAIMRRERPFAGTLTNWDEAAVYGLLCALTVTVSQVAPS